MSEKRRFVIPAIIGLGLLTALPVLIALQGQTTPEKSKSLHQRFQQPDMGEVKSTFPRVSYTFEEISEPFRKAKSQKYGRVRTIDPNISENAQEMITADWEVGVDAVPVAKSVVIVLGIVVDAAAYLSDNKQGVYSEFKIEIEKVFKNDTDQELKKGDYLFAERDGGVVIFPTGFEKWVYIRSQRMPTKGRRYLFFLNRDFPLTGKQISDLNLLTAYEFKGELVTPLDFPGGDTSPFLTFKGRKPEELIKTLKEGLKDSSCQPSDDGGGL